jgi:hypothetical protein
MAIPASENSENKNVVSGSKINAGENIHIGDIVHQHFSAKSPTVVNKKLVFSRLLIGSLTFIILGFAAYLIWQNRMGLSAHVSKTEVLPDVANQKQPVLKEPFKRKTGRQNEEKPAKEKIEPVLFHEIVEEVALDFISFQKKDTIKIDGSDKVKQFSVGRHEVTVAQYWAFCKSTGTSFPHKTVDTLKKNYPMNNVSWYEADAYCKYLGGRLLSLEEWILVALKITGPDSLMTESEKIMISWNNNNSQNVLHPVGKKTTLNRINIHDVFGNVEEWCSDGPTSDYKYTVGGYFKSYSATLDLRRKPVFTRANAKSNIIGFRVAF